MKCPFCGSDVNENTNFCTKCGSPIENNNPNVGQVNNSGNMPMPPQKPNKQQFYNKWWFWVLIVLLAIFIIGAIFGDDNENGKKPDSTSVSQTTTISTTEIKTTTTVTEKPTTTTTVKETTTPIATTKKQESNNTNVNKVIFNNRGIKITYTGIEKDEFETELKFLIENNSGQDYTVQMRDTSVNGYMIEPTFSCEVKNGKKANDTASFFNSDLEDNNISKIKTVEFSFTVFNWDDDSNDFDTVMITLNL